MTEEQFLRERLVAIEREYQKAIKPYVDRLVAIECLKSPMPLRMTLERYQALKDAITKTTGGDA